jgi:Zn finger protein HypA/HybF involved in hydrogenase expression
MSLICPRCGFPLKIVSGKELQLEFIEIEDHYPASTAVA